MTDLFLQTPQSPRNHPMCFYSFLVNPSDQETQIIMVKVKFVKVHKNKSPIS